MTRTTRNTAVVAVAALMVLGTSAALAVGSGPADSAATDGAPLAQDTETTTVADDETDDETATANETTTTAGELTDQEASVIFLNQTAGFTFTGENPNTTTVLVERVVVPEGGFLAVHEAQNVSGEYEPAENVSVGPVVGNSTYLEPGDHSNVVVELDGDLNGSQTLVAMPHRDTNDNQRYEFPEADDPYTIAGSPVIETAYIIADYDVLTEGDGAADDETENETTTEA